VEAVTATATAAIVASSIVEGVWIGGSAGYRSGWYRRGGGRRGHPQRWRRNCRRGHPQRWCRDGSNGSVGEDDGELSEDLYFAVTERSKRRVGCGIVESVDDVIGAGNDKVDGGGEGHGDFGGEPGERVADTLTSGVPDPDAVAAVRVEGWANVPAIGGMGGPSCAGAGFFVGKDTSSRRGKGRPIVIEGAMDLGIG
jgi:hypothetical protein